MTKSSVEEIVLDMPSAFTPAVASHDVLHEIFERTVDAFPHNIAVRSAHFNYTYASLEERANQIAHILRAKGISAGDRVLMMLPRSEHVYAVMLGILKSGAAYVPIDLDYPMDRVTFIAQDSSAKLFVTTSDTHTKLKGFALPLCEIALLDDLLAAKNHASRLSRVQTGVSENDLCYLIYTSGTTGRPKGCQIEHRNICALIDAESKEFGITSSDVVFQGFSVAFDASLEEIWGAFAHGATLFVGTKGIMQSGNFLSTILADAGVTVLSCVPTLLAMVDQDIPTVRILIFGGESCPPDLIARWHRPGRVIYNTYGPTEATVVATLAMMHPGEPVTIGRPLRNYSAFVVDQDLNEVPAGTEGELMIGGVGVVRGYLNRPDLNEQKFIESSRYTGESERFYRTGDLVRLNRAGNLEFLGRADDQIKIRGFRVELSEIDALLLQCPGVLAAATSFLKDTQQIAAFIVARDDMTIDRKFIRTYLLERVPSFMIPAYLDELAVIPTLTSGKVDRKCLPTPKTLLLANARELVKPANDLEKIIFGVWEKVFSKSEISVADHFFLDLGGHSLLAAQAANLLRAHKYFQDLSVADIYTHSSIRELADHWQAKTTPKQQHPRNDQSKHKSNHIHHTTNLRFMLSGVIQAVGVIPIAGLYAWEWLGPYFIYAYMVLHHYSIGAALLAALVTYFVTIPSAMLIGIIVKWTILGRVKPGHYPMWGGYYLRFWFVRTLLRAMPIQQFVGTPFINLYCRALGMKVGRGVYLGTGNIQTFDTIQIGHGSSISGDASIDGASFEDGWLKIRTISIGNHCWIGHRSLLGGNNRMEDGSQLDELSALPTDAHIGRGQRYGGSPATHQGPSEASRYAATPTWTPAVSIALSFAVLFVPLMVLVAVFPGLMIITYFNHGSRWLNLFWGAPLAACSFVIGLCILSIAMKWLVLGRLKEGIYPTASSFYVRKWFVDHLLNLSLEVTGTLYATLYLRPFFKMLGAQMGPRAEISTVRFLQPDLFSAGNECFLADDVSVGAPKIMNGWIEIRNISVGHRTFVGNSALLTGGTNLGDQVLVGVLSRPPEQNPVPHKTSWIGASGILLPKRDEPPEFSEQQTYRPTTNLIAQRYAIEFLRVILPSTLFIFTSALMLNIVRSYYGTNLWWLHLFMLPFLYLIAGACGLLTVVAIKWLVVGKYRVANHPLWSNFVWRSELVTGVYENFGVLFFLDLLRGTPFLPWCLRLFGMKIGRRCYFDTTWFTEFDLISIGNDVILNEDANIQTHLFEDRIFKLGSIKIGRRCTVGTMATILYDTEMKAGSKLGDLSLLMKGEILPAHTAWAGSPIKAD